MNNIRLGDVLIDFGYITRDQLQAALAYQKEHKNLRVGQALQELGYVNEHQVLEALAQRLHLRVIDFTQINADISAVEKVPRELAQKYDMLPIAINGRSLVIAANDPLNYYAIEDIRQLTSMEPEIVLAELEPLRRSIQYYYAEVRARKAASKANSSDMAAARSEEFAVDMTEEGGDTDAPIIRLVQQMLTDAFKMRASDIHIEPMENRLRIRYRVDGKLVEVATHPKKLLSPIIARLKVMSTTMSIAEKRMPQDGRIQMNIGGKQIDLRVSSVPSNHGESIVMRILDKSALVLGLPQLGFFSDDEAVFDRLITLPDGIILVTGPTGSGKTTTLYACLNHINRPDKKIITVEDPVEYELSGINQVMVKADIGMTFAAALRAMLRQAPNIIMIGEIRDMETASIAINASLTGHLVFSTLHTNDAPSAVARLADIGIKRFLIASSVRAIMAQRLVRKLCDRCKVDGVLTEKQAHTLNIDMSRLTPGQIKAPHGCDFCRGGGFKGRMGLFEIFEIDDEVRRMINENLTSPQLRQRARELGMRTLREDGVRKVLAGLTSPEEVLNVTMGDAN